MVETWISNFTSGINPEYHRAYGTNGQQIKPGDVVLVHDDTPRVKWRLAVIGELVRGNDGMVRASKIRITQGRTNCPIAKLIPLELSSDMVSYSSEAIRTSFDDITDMTCSPGSSDGGTAERESRPQRRATQRCHDKVRKWVVELSSWPIH